MERPLVFSALRANSRADGNDLVARHAGDLFRPGRRVGHVVVVAPCDVARRRSRDRGRNWRRADRTRSRPASRPPPAGAFSPERCAPARRDDRCRGNGRARGCRNRGKPTAAASSSMSARDRRSFVSRPPKPFPRGSICPSRPSETRRSPSARRLCRSSRHKRPSSIRDCWSRRMTSAKSEARTNRSGT